MKDWQIKSVSGTHLNVSFVWFVSKEGPQVKILKQTLVFKHLPRALDEELSDYILPHLNNNALKTPKPMDLEQRCTTMVSYINISNKLSPSNARCVGSSFKRLTKVEDLKEHTHPWHLLFYLISSLYLRPFFLIFR